MDEIISILPSLIACCSSANQLLRENALGALSNLAAHDALQPRIVELQGQLAMLKVLQDGSGFLHGHCARGLQLLAENQTSCFMDPAVLGRLVELLTTPVFEAQLSSLSILGRAFSSWALAPSAAQAEAVEHFTKMRGFQALMLHLTTPCMEEHAACCISKLAQMQSSWPASSMFGMLWHLSKKLSRISSWDFRECLDSPSKLISAANTQRYAAEAIARLVADPQIARQVAGNPDAIQAMKILLHSPCAAVWAAAVQAMALVTDTQSCKHRVQWHVEDVKVIAVGPEAVTSQDTACQLAHLLGNLVKACPACDMQLGGALECLTWMLGYQSTVVRREAAQAIYALAVADQVIKRKCGAGDIFRQLTVLSQSSDEQLQMAAKNALQCVTQSRFSGSCSSTGI